MANSMWCMMGCFFCLQAEVNISNIATDQTISHPQKSKYNISMLKLLRAYRILGIIHRRKHLWISWFLEWLQMFSCYHFLSCNYFDKKCALLIATANSSHCLNISDLKRVKITADQASWLLTQNSSIHVNQRIRLPNEIKANRETCKVWKNACTSY